MSPDQKFALGWLVAILAICVVGMIVVGMSAARIARNPNASPKVPDDRFSDVPRGKFSATLLHDNPPLEEPVAHCDRIGNDGWDGWQRRKETR